MTATSGNGWSGDTQMQADHDAFAPRVGISYHAFNPLVIRAGYGVFHQFINRIGSESHAAAEPALPGSLASCPTGWKHDPVFRDGCGERHELGAVSEPEGICDLLVPGPAVTCITGTLMNGVCVNGVAGGLPTQHVRAQGVNNRTSYIRANQFRLCSIRSAGTQSRPQTTSATGDGK